MHHNSASSPATPDGSFGSAQHRRRFLKLALLGGAALAGLKSFEESDALSAGGVSRAQDRRILA
ncbi:MAG: hypothetical protein ACJ74V_13520, partial [Gaiellaceae bacterium]